MRLAAFRTDDGTLAVGRILDDDTLIEPLAAAGPVDEIGVAALIDEVPVPVGDPVPLDQSRLCAPIPRPRRNIFCIGKNYAAHVRELAIRAGRDPEADTPNHPVVFTKVPECVIGPGEAIRINPAVSTSIDYEAELAVVIGRGGRGIPAETALDHVFGYTIVNDVTARDLQARHGQFLLAKAQDSFCPMGPWLTLAEAVNPADLKVQCRVNDDLRQDGSTSDLLFDIPTLIATISAGITLLPGDIIATGTPAGVGAGFDPPKWLRAGDSVSVWISGLGTLSNPVGMVDEPAA